MRSLLLLPPLLLVHATLCLLPAVAQAGGPGERVASGVIRLVLPAESVRFSVTIHSDQEVVDYQLYELGEARRLLMEAAKANGKLSVNPNPAELSFYNTSRYNFSSGREGGSDLTLNLFYPINEGFDYLACAREANALVKGIKIPEKARFQYGIQTMGLWVAEPEKHRPELLKLFADQVQAMTAALGGGKVKLHVANLLTPIGQRPLSDTQVELSLEPTVTLDVE